MEDKEVKVLKDLKPKKDLENHKKEDKEVKV